MMLPFGLMARLFFRRIEDASGFASNMSENGGKELKEVRKEWQTEGNEVLKLEE